MVVLKKKKSALVKVIKLGKVASTKSNRGESVFIVSLYISSTPPPANSGYLFSGNSLGDNIS